MHRINPIVTFGLAGIIAVVATTVALSVGGDYYSRDERTPRPREIIQAPVDASAEPSRSGGGGDRVAAMTQDLTESAMSRQQSQPGNREFEPGEHFGALVASSSIADVIRIYGRENVAPIAIDIGAGQTQMGTVVYKGTPNEFQILWMNPDQQLINTIVVTGSRWQMDDGLRVGAPLETLTTINLSQPNYYPFGTDFGGYVSDWSEGRLGAYGPSLEVELKPAQHQVAVARILVGLK